MFAGVLVLGFVLLVVGAEVLIRSSTELARRMGLPSTVIGLTVVAYGTSAPEFVFSFQNASMGQADLAVANVVGSNIYNQFFILGLSAVILPLSIHNQLIRLDVPLVIGLSAGLLVLSLDGRFSLLEGGFLLAGLVAYSVFSIRYAGTQPNGVSDDSRRMHEPDARGAWIQTPGSGLLSVGVIVGVGLLVLGSRWFSGGAIDLARYFGISEWVIGATIVAAATSFPELATSVLAALKGEDDIAVANVVGSSIFNILGVLGGSVLLSGNGLSVDSRVIAFDLPVMVMSSLACFPFFLSDFRLARWEGCIFLLYFVAYTVLLFDGWLPLSHTSPGGTAVFLAPLAGVTLFVFVKHLRGSTLGPG